MKIYWRDLCVFFAGYVYNYEGGLLQAINYEPPTIFSSWTSSCTWKKKKVDTLKTRAASFLGRGSILYFSAEILRINF